MKLFVFLFLCTKFVPFLLTRALDADELQGVAQSRMCERTCSRCFTHCMLETLFRLVSSAHAHSMAHSPFVITVHWFELNFSARSHVLAVQRLPAFLYNASLDDFPVFLALFDHVQIVMKHLGTHVLQAKKFRKCHLSKSAVREHEFGSSFFPFSP